MFFFQSGATGNREGEDAGCIEVSGGCFGQRGVWGVEKEILDRRRKVEGAKRLLGEFKEKRGQDEDSGQGEVKRSD